MFRFAALIAGGLATAAATTIVASLLAPTSLLAPSLDGNPVSVTGAVNPLVAHTIDRSLKGDRLMPPPQAKDISKNPQIAIVEVVGIRDAAVVYRDRSGRELFRTDPISNVTIITKGLVLPQVTIKESDQAEVMQVPVDAPRPPVSPQPAEGCEAVVSPFTAPSLSHIVGRCLAGTGANSKYAAAGR
jgi:hypothetical protein